MTPLPRLFPPVPAAVLAVLLAGCGSPPLLRFGENLADPAPGVRIGESVCQGEG